MHDPTDKPADTDPLLHLVWIDRHGVPCESVIVGVIASALLEWQTVNGFDPSAVGSATLLTVASYEQLQRSRLDVRDQYSDVKVLGYREGLFSALKRLWLKLVEVSRHDPL